jgi:hypothetical protein
VHEGAIPKPRRLPKENADSGAVGDLFGIQVVSRLLT